MGREGGREKWSWVDYHIIIKSYYCKYIKKYRTVHVARICEGHSLDLDND